ncbi:MAG: diacylglycerol kinase family protein [Proteiniphilum sp.]
MSYFKKRIQSFKHAFRGIRTLFRETPNAWIQLAATVPVILLGVLFRLSRGEWLALVIVTGAVFSMEAVNTALERLSDYACNKEIHPLVKETKDLAAAGVLIAALTALIVGVIIFVPKVVELLF